MKIVFDLGSAQVEFDSTSPAPSDFIGFPRDHPPAMPQNDTLDRIPRGDSVRILSVAGEDAIARRLDDLGLRVGVEVEVIRRAPLGDPTVFELHGYQLCLRQTESERVRVEPAADGGSGR